MKIIERNKKICKDCGKNLEGDESGFGIPVFKGFYFVREWICTDCMLGRVEKRAYEKRKEGKIR